MPVQARRGPHVPDDRRGEVTIVNQWLPKRLGRPLRAAEAQTFGRMALDEWRKRYGSHLKPYTVRVGTDHSQKTAWLPEHMPLLESALARYRNSRSYKRIEAELAVERRREFARRRLALYADRRVAVVRNGSTYEVRFHGETVAAHFLTEVDAMAWVNSCGLFDGLARNPSERKEGRR